MDERYAFVVVSNADGEGPGLQQGVTGWLGAELQCGGQLVRLNAALGQRSEADLEDYLCVRQLAAATRLEF